MALLFESWPCYLKYNPLEHLSWPCYLSQFDSDFESKFRFFEFNMFTVLVNIVSYLSH